ncbi:MAG: hypothetical protein KJ914_15735 [Gammaproteobacteria bacterium]|nr:hypothetical protein [Gammaproteobacteria bacterium]MBU1723680.1 hypothetical protein [Gammaproteobacteria bacterium]MBU2004764.1 hypothetical protein [Gammaproteobacteria bacterium]
MNNGMLVPQAQGVFFPAHKQHVFHRINLEYLVPLRGMKRQGVYGLLNAGIRNNLRKFGSAEDVLRSLRPQLEVVASHVSMQGLRLMREREDFASKKLAESLDFQGSDADKQVLVAECLLKNSLEVNSQNHRAHFELGWIYLFMLGKLPQAAFHFGQAAQLAQGSDPAFAAFALRHLADTHYGLHDPGNAVEASLAALGCAQQTDMENLYECARYLAVAGDSGAAVRRLVQVVARSPVYYVQAQVEPDFGNTDEISGVLQDLRSIKVNRIKTYVHHNWKQSPLASLPLPDGLDSGVLFRQVFQQHARVISHLPYVTLSQREKQIGDIILEASQKRIMREVRRRSFQYEQHMEQQRCRWSWVNQLGGTFIHTSIVLLLGSLAFYLLRFATGLLGVGSLLGSDAIITAVLGSILLLGATGVSLFQFVPFGMKKLLRKQVELDNTLHLLQTS